MIAGGIFHIIEGVNPLSFNETRVLGALIEKDITTPDYYPMSLNALVNACNQKNNREPVTSLNEEDVRSALEALQTQNLAGPARGADSRVAKFEHRAYEALALGRREIAVLCVLLLRGPQTPGELRGRTERLYAFDDVTDVQSTLQKLMERDPALAAMLPRQPGTKESRFAHLLSGAVESAPVATPETRQPHAPGLAQEVVQLRQEVEELKRQFEEFKRRFE